VTDRKAHHRLPPSLPLSRPARSTLTPDKSESELDPELERSKDSNRFRAQMAIPESSAITDTSSMPTEGTPSSFKALHHDPWHQMRTNSMSMSLDGTPVNRSDTPRFSHSIYRASRSPRESAQSFEEPGPEATATRVGDLSAPLAGSPGAPSPQSINKNQQFVAVPQLSIASSRGPGGVLLQGRARFHYDSESRLSRGSRPSVNEANEGDKARHHSQGP